ncbi:MAG: hypothetical protein GXO90_00940 [FCB group bacterium]|nr:hypothetical protein [FCB group bacterium]
MNTHPLPVKERRKLGRLAHQVGISATVRLTGRNPRTVRKWKARVARGEALTSPNDQLSPRETRQLLRAAPRQRKDTLAQCRQRAGVTCSAATLSRLYRYSDWVMPDIQLVHYTLSGKRKYLTVISIHYSVPRSLLTPGGPARRVTAKTVPFYWPRKSDWFLYHGEIFPVEDPLFATAIRPYLGPKDDTTAWFISLRPDPQKHPWHIIKGYYNDLPHTFCGQEFSPESGLQAAPPAAIRDSQQPLCRKCLPPVIAAYQRNRNLKPSYEIRSAPEPDARISHAPAGAAEPEF